MREIEIAEIAVIPLFFIRCLLLLPLNVGFVLGPCFMVWLFVSFLVKQSSEEKRIGDFTLVVFWLSFLCDSSSWHRGLVCGL